METRLKMTLAEFKKIGKYEDADYLTFNYEETLFEELQSLSFGASKQYEKKKSALTKGQKIFLVYVALSSQIRNGGISQYYWNTGGEYLKDHAAVLKVINLEKFSKLLKASDTFFLKNTPALKKYMKAEAKDGNMGNYFGDWAELFEDDPLDDYFYSNVEKIEKKMFKFLMDNPKEFITG